MSAHEIKALATDSVSDPGGFNHIERAVLIMTTELLTTHGVPSSVFDEVHKTLGTAATIEVLMLVNRWAGLALILNAVDVDLDECARISIPTTDRAHHDS